MIVVKAQIKEYAVIDERQFSISNNFAEELDKKVKDIVQKACWRAKENGRTTIMSKDI